jgi:hypothetical protein
LIVETATGVFLSLAISRILLVTTISSNSLEFEVKTIVPKFL